MDINEIGAWIGVALGALALITQAKTYFSSGEKDLGARLDKTEKQVADRLERAEKTLIDHDRRIQATETELRHLPDKDTVTELKLALAELRGIVATMGETVGSVSRTVHRIDDFLMSNRAS